MQHADGPDGLGPAHAGAVIFDSSVHPDPVQLASLRRSARAAMLDAGVPATAVEDLVLIISELASNAIVASGDGTWIGVAVRHNGRAVTVTVDNDGAPPPREVPELPPPVAPRGRGLAIVDSLSSTVDTDHSRGRSRVSAVYQLTD